MSKSVILAVLDLSGGELIVWGCATAVSACLSACLYFIPTIVAVVRRHRNAMAIAWLNLFLGWTCLGWIAALIWACLR